MIRFICLLIFSSPLYAQLSDYKKIVGISGVITAVGSDTLARPMSEWERAFRLIYPNVNLQLQAAGSSTAPIALIQGTTDIGMMSRKMKSTELASFYQVYGYYPLQLTVAMDAEVILVNRSNPLSAISIQQLDMMYSATYRCGGNEKIKRWSQLGITKAGFEKVQLFGRNSSSGTYGYFKQKALCGGDFNPYVQQLPSAAYVAESVANNKQGIGYAALGFANAKVKAVPIRVDGEVVAATKANIRQALYPLSRELFFYINQQPNKPLKPVLREFVRFIYSRQGQQIVEGLGFISLADEKVWQSLKSVEQ